MHVCMYVCMYVAQKPRPAQTSPEQPRARSSQGEPGPQCSPQQPREPGAARRSQSPNAAHTSPDQPRTAQRARSSQEEPETPSGSIWGAGQLCYVDNTKKTPLTIFESQMWGGPLWEAIWATRGSQEEPERSKDKTKPNGSPMATQGCPK